MSNGPADNVKVVWDCLEPPAGQGYWVVRESWNSDYTERHIQEIHILPDPQYPMQFGMMGRPMPRIDT
jgi:hypothetical protein